MTESPYAENTPEYRVWEVAQRNGKAAASWVFDGNTTRETYAACIKMLDEGDPALYDFARTPSLSGEFAGEYSEDDLMSDVGWVEHDGTEMRDELASQYINEVSDAFWYEVDRAARYQLSEDDQS